MADERGTAIDIGGKVYELLLTTRATKEIAKRYGGLEKLGESLLAAEGFEPALEELLWLITLLCNQTILIHNLKDKENPQPLLQQEDLELLTSPIDLAAYKDAITEALMRGTARHVESEDSPSKNARVG